MEATLIFKNGQKERMANLQEIIIEGQPVALYHGNFHLKVAELDLKYASKMVTIDVMDSYNWMD